MLNGGLFTRDFLIEGIQGTAAWDDLDETLVADLKTRIEVLLPAFRKLKNQTEAETEKELIWPLLEALG